MLWKNMFKAWINEWNFDTFIKIFSKGMYCTIFVKIIEDFLMLRGS